MTVVTQRSNETVDSLLRRFNRKVSKAGTLGEIRRRRWHIPRSEQQRLDRKKAIRRLRRRQSMMRSDV